eukprot:gnl/TRDRNA2_/TRDRNA2_167896_c1_seq6.p1 gnl/TRDRNA2_/TRDRNA2_167896_c1~~gnl/TRDRNA2_/TRDRNA2_167896_c1_seq6.p1  ORF type:complete len:201 (-),score=19.56 gnl/TRDRNA2_/TRDRNA2_167896_c1_seq6:31-558(-)
MDGTQHMVDDKPAIAHILQEGMKICHKVTPARRFLSRLGAEGNTYSEMIVSPLPVPARRLMQENYPSSALQEGSDHAAEDCATSEDLCRTIRSTDVPQTALSRAPSMHRCPTQDRMAQTMPATAYRGYPAHAMGPRMDALGGSMIAMGGHPRAGLQVLQRPPSSAPQAYHRPLTF